jgi:uncharacterized BrkB/YihY/UPF0761 family membrane protein
VSTLAAGLSSLVDLLPGYLPVGPALGHVIGWSVSILSVLGLFLLMYKLLPNVIQGWRDVMPGALLSSALLLVVSQVFPLYVALFPPNQAYALFGVFLVLTFWLYLVGFVFVLGAELNAFLHGVRVAAPQLSPVPSPVPSPAPAAEPPRRASIAGRILGFIGLVFAVLLLRNRTLENSGRGAAA